MIPNQGFKEFVIDTAKQTQIPLQLSQMSSGGTDGGKIHMNRTGCPTVVITVPTRHIHSHVGMLSLKDTENAIRLLLELIKRLDSETVESFTVL
jgi:endoglucanase